VGGRATLLAATQGARRARLLHSLLRRVRAVPTPTLPGTDRQAQRDWPPKVELLITMGTAGADWARQRRLVMPHGNEAIVGALGSGPLQHSMTETDPLATRRGRACGENGR
jgi:hypothetical protein